MILILCQSCSQSLLLGSHWGCGNETTCVSEHIRQNKLMCSHSRLLYKVLSNAYCKWLWITYQLDTIQYQFLVCWSIVAFSYHSQVLSSQFNPTQAFSSQNGGKEFSDFESVTENLDTSISVPPMLIVDSDWPSTTIIVDIGIRQCIHSFDLMGHCSRDL